MISYRALADDMVGAWQGAVGSATVGSEQR
jgi:hypothetical protein